MPERTPLTKNLTYFEKYGEKLTTTIGIHVNFAGCYDLEIGDLTSIRFLRAGLETIYDNDTTQPRDSIQPYKINTVNECYS